MERRTLIAMGLGLSAGGALSAPAAAQSALRLTLLTDQAGPAAALADRLSATSGGRIALDVAVEADPRGFLARVGGGEADMYMASQDAFVSEQPALGLFAAMPGGMAGSELEGWLVASDGQIFWDDLNADAGVTAFLAGDDGPQPLWSAAPVADMAMLQGARVGSTGLGVLTLRKMGVDAADIADPSVDLVGLDMLEGLSLVQMADRGLLSRFTQMVAPNAGRPCSARSVGIASARWNSLDDGDRTLVERCILAHHAEARMRGLTDNARALKANAANLSVQTMPEPLWQAQIDAANGVMRDILDRADLNADAADAYLYFLADVAGWSEIGEVAFFNGRRRGLSQ